jgi:hypothetical protein
MTLSGQVQATFPSPGQSITELQRNVIEEYKLWLYYEFPQKRTYSSQPERSLG